MLDRELLATAEFNLRDADPKLKLADWCREHDLPTLGDVWEWLGRTGRAPYQQGSSWTWFGNVYSRGPQHALPGPLWHWASEEMYGSLEVVVASLVPAWKKAVKSGVFRKWKPDYKLIAWVEAKDLEMFKAMQGER
jgi:hypothetical protein